MKKGSLILIVHQLCRYTLSYVEPLRTWTTKGGSVRIFKITRPIRDTKLNVNAFRGFQSRNSDNQTAERSHPSIISVSYNNTLSGLDRVPVTSKHVSRLFIFLRSDFQLYQRSHCSRYLFHLSLVFYTYSIISSPFPLFKHCLYFRAVDFVCVKSF